MSFNKCAGIYDQLQDLVNDTQSDMTKFVEGNATLQARESEKQCKQLKAWHKN